jgi:type VI protein secretion system component Hcp
MATGTTTEIMMQFIDKSGNPVAAECTTVIGPNDQLATNPVQGYAGGFTSPNYFLVDSFKFGMTLNDSETKNNKSANDKLLATLKDSKDPAMHKILKHLTTNKNAAFSRWRSAEQWKQEGSNAAPYNAHVDEFSFTRRIDTASATLFAYCASQDSFQFASLIKRKSAAVVDSNYPENQSYLRIDFADVQISNFQLSDDDVVEESCSFRAKKMLVQFWTEGKDPATQTDGILALFDKVSWENKVTPASSGPGK